MKTGHVCQECINEKGSPVARYLTGRQTGPLLWTVDDGFLRAAISEGCDPPLCHACERPLGLGQKISLAQVANPDGNPRNPNVAAIAHIECCLNKVPNMTAWRKKHG